MKVVSFWNPQKKSKKKVRSKPISFIPKTNLFPVRSTKENRLIRKDPWGDADKDGVKNWFDCKPLDRKRQEFKSFRSRKKKIEGYTEPEQFTAARRFGGANIKRLKKIGSGRDRIVYALDKDKVLKIAKNPGGLTQNMSESELDYPTGQIKHYETGKDYVVMERASPPGESTKKMIKHLKKAVAKSSLQNPDVHRAEFFNSPEFEKSGLDSSDFSSHSVAPGEFAAKRQWGEKEGKPVLIDAGALMSGRDLRRYRIKHFHDPIHLRVGEKVSDQWQLDEWREVQQQRRAFRDKGKKKLQLKEYDRKSGEARPDILEPHEQEIRMKGWEEDYKKDKKPEFEMKDTEGWSATTIHKGKPATVKRVKINKKFVTRFVDDETRKVIPQVRSGVDDPDSSFLKEEGKYPQQQKGYREFMEKHGEDLESLYDLEDEDDITLDLPEEDNDTLDLKGEEDD